MSDRTPASQSAPPSIGSEHASRVSAGAHVAAARQLLVRAVRSGPDTEVLLQLLDALDVLISFRVTHPCPPAPAAAPVGADAGLDRVLLLARAELGRSSLFFQPGPSLEILHRAHGHIAQADRIHGRSP